MSKKKNRASLIVPEVAATMTLEDTFKQQHYRVSAGPMVSGHGYKFELAINGYIYSEGGSSVFYGHPSALSAVTAGRLKFGEWLAQQPEDTLTRAVRIRGAIPVPERPMLSTKPAAMRLPSEQQPAGRPLSTRSQRGASAS